MNRITDEMIAREMVKSLDPIEREIAFRWIQGEKWRRMDISHRYAAIFEDYCQLMNYRATQAGASRGGPNELASLY